MRDWAIWCARGGLTFFFREIFLSLVESLLQLIYRLTRASPYKGKQTSKPRNNRTYSDGLRGSLGVESLQVIHVVAHSNEQVKEQFATNLHLHLHGAAALERLPASDNQC